LHYNTLDLFSLRGERKPWARSCRCQPALFFVIK